MRRGLIAMFCLIAVATAAAPAHAARAWGEPQAAVSGDGIPMVAPQARFTSRGELVAAWSMKRPQNEWIPEDSRRDGEALRVAVRAPGAGSFGRAQTLDAAAWPFLGLATDEAGGTLLAWLSDSYELKVSSRQAGSEFGPPRVIASATSVDLAVNARGDAALVFRGADYGPWLAFRPAGGDFGAPVRLAPSGTVTARAFPDVGVSADGTAVVVWEDDTAEPGPTARAVVRSPGGALSPVSRLSRPGWHGQHPQVAVSPGGQAAAVWTEALTPHSSGPVMTATLRGGCCFSPAAPTGITSIWFGARVSPLEGSAAVVSAFGLDRELAARQTHPYGPTVLGIDMASGARTAPTRLGPGAWGSDITAVNPRGDAVVAMGYSTLDVTRRPPGGAFERPTGIDCDRYPLVNSLALSRAGDAALFFTPSTGGEAAGPAWLIEDREAAQAGRDCRPVKRRRVRGSLALQARLPRGGRLERRRWLKVRVFCGVACRIRADGSVRVPGRRTRLELSPASARRSRAGTTTLRVGLSRRRARVVRRALGRHRAVRARLRVSAGGGGSSRSLTFKVRLRR